MKKELIRPEVLAPAGTLEKLKKLKQIPMHHRRPSIEK